ncbi:MAG: leucine-rich repeat protein [Bacteroides sp.]|nr:leucine-rich repeat protein [Bacteroides sp.]
MRKPLLAMLLAMLSCLAASAAVGDTFTSGDLTFTITSESPAEVSVKATDAKTISGDVVIPSTITDNSITYSVTSVDDNAFFSASLITSISIPQTVTKIGSYAFQSCTNCQAINIPDNVTTIGVAAYSNLAKIAAFSISEDNEYYTVVDGALYNKNKNRIIAYPGGKTDANFDIPMGVDTVSTNCFINNKYLESVTIPDGVTNIMFRAFRGIDKLKSISLPGSLKTVGYGAFCDCKSLTEILTIDSSNSFYSEDGVLYNWTNKTNLVQYPAGKSDVEFVAPSTLTKIAAYAFYGCSTLQSITIPAGIDQINDYTFYNCSDLTKFVNLNPTPQSVGEGAFNSIKLSNVILYVPSSSKEAYASANVWNTFKEIRGIEFYLDINEATLRPGETLDLKNKIVNTEDITIKSLTWNSSDTDIATVDSEGVVTAVADGKATITVSAVDENDQTYTDECEITVDSTSDITVITTDSKGVIDYSAAYDVFTVNGVLVGKSVESLAPGLYIVRQKAASAKILVK